MSKESAGIHREKRTIRPMVRIYCRAHHGPTARLCADCTALLDYALSRLDRCPAGADKPTCAHCTVHCYKPPMRQGITAAMRFAGPRMI